MALHQGARLGAYEILSLIGSGGMGEVYRARDTKLNRDVALKILPEAFALDAERIARFKREAQVLASLNHPNIATIHGFEDASGTPALVMELVEGPTLAELIDGDSAAQSRMTPQATAPRRARGATARGSGAPRGLKIEDALAIGRQTADALEAAHEQGIIHRDLKPANIKVREDGTVKVLDFGLAKLADPAAAGVHQSAIGVTSSPTITTPAMTQLGLILGTAAYMSPEQAKGRPADKRSDIWAFGAVLYEMLSGQRAFEGDDVSDTLAAVLRQDVDWSNLPPSTSAAVRRLIARCLDRDPKRRLRDVGEARIVLEDPAARGATNEQSSSAALPIGPPRPLWRRAIPILLTAAISAVATVTAAWMLLKPTTEPIVTRFPVTLPEGQNFAATGRHMVAISPDGTQMVYVATPGRLYLRSMSTRDAKPIQGLDGVQAAISPTFSPDGHYVVFYANADGTLKKIAVTGGTPVTLCPADNPLGISWEGDAIIFGQGRKGLMRVSANGGTPEVLVHPKDDEVMQSPQLLPDGRTVVFTVATSTRPDRWDTADIVAQSLTTGERRTLVHGGSDARFVATGHLVYAVRGTVFAVPFDLRRLEVKGGPVPVVEGVRRASGNPPVTGAANFSVSRTGTLIYLPGPIAPLSDQLEIVVANGSTTSRLKLQPGPYVDPRISPNGQRIAFDTDDGKDATVWVYELSGATSMQRLTFVGRNRFPIWSADSKRVVYQSDRDGDLGMFATATDGSGGTERLTRADRGTAHVPESWSPNGDELAFSVITERDHALWIYSMQSRKATPFDDVHSSTPLGAVFSPDGRWIAYTSTQQQRPTVYVQPFPPNGAKYQIVAQGLDGPHHPVWSPNGKALFYIPRQAAFESVSVTVRPTFAFGNPVPVPRPFNGTPPEGRRSYDITPDGKFIGLVPAGFAESGAATTPAIEVVVSWTEELKQRVPVK